MKYVITEIRDRIGYIILNRPDKRNALNSEFVSELKISIKNKNANIDESLKCLLYVIKNININNPVKKLSIAL